MVTTDGLACGFGFRNRPTGSDGVRALNVMNGTVVSGIGCAVTETGAEANVNPGAVVLSEKRICVVPLLKPPAVMKFAVNTATGSVPPGQLPAASFHSTIT